PAARARNASTCAWARESCASSEYRSSRAACARAASVAFVVRSAPARWKGVSAPPAAATAPEITIAQAPRARRRAWSLAGLRTRAGPYHRVAEIRLFVPRSLQELL